MDVDDKRDVSEEQIHESSQQARVAQSLQAHDYVSVSRLILLYLKQVFWLIAHLAK